MKFIKSVLLLSFLLPFVSEAQVEMQENNPNSLSPDTVSNNSLLWRIDGNELEHPSYVFGTIHLIGKKDFFFPDYIQTAFDDCEQVYFEIKIDDMMNLGSQMSLMMKMYMKNGIGLKDLVEEEEYNMVKKHFEKLGMPFMMFERMKPLFLSMFASEDMSTQGFASGEMMSYEIELMGKAKKAEKPIAGLETAEFQMSLFDSIPYEAQAKMLITSIQTSKAGDDEFDRMVEMYKAQNIEGMQSMVDEDEEGFGKYEGLLLLKRNRNWIPVMEEAIAKQPTFFAVGAGHLGGEEGVVQLLKNKGYTLTPVKVK